MTLHPIMALKIKLSQGATPTHAQPSKQHLAQRSMGALMTTLMAASLLMGSAPAARAETAYEKRTSDMARRREQLASVYVTAPDYLIVYACQACPCSMMHCKAAFPASCRTFTELPPVEAMCVAAVFLVC